MDTYLVTGGAGFIGSNFIVYMLEKHDDIKIVNLDALTYAGNLENLKSVEEDPRYFFEYADIRDKDRLREIFEEHRPNYVVNFAAESHVDRSIVDPNCFIDTNVVGTLNLLNAAKALWMLSDGSFKEGSKFLQISTDEVYGALKLEESDMLFSESTPINPHSPYSASKASADLLVKAYYSTYGMPVNITRCSNNYGPNQYPEKLIPLMIGNSLKHINLPIYGDGKNVRDWLYVEDHCKAIDLVMNKGKEGEIYNIGGHNEYSNNYIVKTIISTCKQLTDDDLINEELIEYVEDRKGHDRRYGIDPTKISTELGWSPEITFEDGILSTIKWYICNKDRVYECTGE